MMYIAVALYCFGISMFVGALALTNASPAYNPMVFVGLILMIAANDLTNRDRAKRQRK